MVIVEGINIATRHVKAGTGAKETGFVQKELPIHISNLIYKDPMLSLQLFLHHPLVHHFQILS